jgi:hypothetical protein
VPALAIAFLAVMLVAALKVVGIIARRLCAGIMQYRLQAAYRRRVTRRYLELPLSWHAEHPTGELLSNANSDVEATWYPIAPFPFAVGVILMLVATLGLLFVTDPVLALVGSVVFPTIAGLTVLYSRRMSPLMTLAQQQRGGVSGIAHESFDGALVVKTLGRETSETERFRTASLELRDTMTAVGRVRGLFDPVMESLPVLGVLAVLLAGTARLGSGDIDAGQLVRVAYLFTLMAFPVRAIGWVLNELPRSVVGWDRVQRVLTATGAQEHGDRVLADTGASALRVEAVSFAYGDADVLHEVAFDVQPGRTVALVGPDGCRQVHPGLGPGPAARPRHRPGGVRRRGRPGAGPRGARLGRLAGPAVHLPVRRHRPRQHHARDRHPGRGRLGGAAGRAGRRLRGRPAQGAGHRRRGARHHAVRRPAPAAVAGPGRRPPPAAARARRRHQQRRPAGGAAHPGRPARPER